VLRLPYRPPYAFADLLQFLAGRAIAGVESTTASSYARTVTLDGAVGYFVVRPSNREASLELELSLSPSRPDAEVSTHLLAAVERVRTLFDLEADPLHIAAHLERDPRLRPIVAAHPGLRVPGGWDGFELAVRAVLGQQVTVEAGRRLAGQLVQACGGTVPDGRRAAGLARVFPGAAQVARADLSGLGMPGARRATLVALAEAALAEPRLFEPLATIEDTVARLCAIRGVGDWTAHYIALRAAREPDAFPASDVGLLRGAADRNGVRPSPAELLARAERWRPWRAYAAQHLWVAGAAPRA
jgi:AraC family transcriptional regulator of adaptative response / DNA-3-methyladenine glycosylase II